MFCVKLPIVKGSGDLNRFLDATSVRGPGEAQMAVAPGAKARRFPLVASPQRPIMSGPIIPEVEVIRQGRVEPFLTTQPMLSSSVVQWGGIALDNYAVPAVLIPHHEHSKDFLHLVLRGSVDYEVKTGGRTLRFRASPGTIFILPRGTVDEIRWEGPTRRIVATISQNLLNNALGESGGMTEIELTGHWNLTDRHISALLVEMTADLEDGSPAGQVYGESLAHTLAVYLLRRYAVRPSASFAYKGGLSRPLLERVRDYIMDNLEENLSLVQLASVAGLSPHYFAQLFKQSVGRAPHQYVLLQRIERAKQQLQDPRKSIIEAAMNAGFENPSHFSYVFRKIVGSTPSRFRADACPERRHFGVR